VQVQRVGIGICVKNSAKIASAKLGSGRSHHTQLIEPSRLAFARGGRRRNGKCQLEIKEDIASGTNWIILSSHFKGNC
jgi:hypothetical protein